MSYSSKTNKNSSDVNDVKKILDYWYLMEFLHQQSLKTQWDSKKTADNYKRKANKNRSSLTDFLEIEKNDNLKVLIETNKEDTKLNYRSNLTIFLGKTTKEICIEKIFKNSGKEDKRPEKDNEQIAIATIKLDKNGSYISNSLSISPLVWSMHKISINSKNITKDLSINEYEKDIKQMEKNISDVFLEIEDDSDLSSEAKLERMDYSFFSKIEKLIFEKLNVNYVKEYNSLIAIYYKLYAKESDIEEDENENLLHFDFYSKDLAMVREKFGNNEVSKEKSKILLDYILGIKRLQNNVNNIERFDIVNVDSQNKDKIYHFLTKTLTAKKAPLGKWPSKYMPALMQQIAINLAIDEENPLPIFSVNGPPGTGKTTLLKEIIVNNVVKKAILLSNYDDPDDAFQECSFTNGNSVDHSYDQYVRKYYRLKNPKINDYSIVVASNNNVAVENITKELPFEDKIKSETEIEHPKSKNEKALNEISKLFRVSESPDTIPRSNDNKVSADVSMEKDIYFSSLATQLLNQKSNDSIQDEKSVMYPYDNYIFPFLADLPVENKRRQAFGLISATLGRKSNIESIYDNVLKPFLNYVKTNESISDRKKEYIKAKNKFKGQLDVVINLQKNQDKELKLYDELNKIEEDIKNVKTQINSKKNNLEDLEAECKIENQRVNLQINSINNEIKEKQEIDSFLSKEIIITKEEKRNQCSNFEKNNNRKKELTDSIGFFSKFFRTSKYKRITSEIEETERCKIQLFDQIQGLEIKLGHLEGEKKNVELVISRLNAQAKAYEENKQTINDKYTRLKDEIQKNDEKNRMLLNDYAKQKNSIEDEIEKCKNQYSFETGFFLGEDFVDKLFSNDDSISAEMHTKNPWLSEQYNREREKLFLYALKMTREFILSSKCCRANFKHLKCLWKRSYDDKTKVDFIGQDLCDVTEATYQTLFLLIPVVSSTFASIQSLFKNACKEDVIGTLIVDEAGQASPYTAIGALYRSKKAIIVGDPNQIEPVVTNDQDLLYSLFQEDDLFTLYADKTNSVQKFADLINPYGTYIKNDLDKKEWVGCPLLIHRRCVSPMFNISNELSYNGLMKQQTKELTIEESETFILDKSQWINIAGTEIGNKNHYVKEQGEEVIKLLEIAFNKSKGNVPNLFIISPFNSVVNGVKNRISGYINDNKDNHHSELANNKFLKEWMKSNIGTVHTFQGKEAAEVIFLLGCDTSYKSSGAIEWVNNNIVNVAVTRAKYRLYVIGDIKAWKSSKCVKRAKEIMDTYAFLEINKELSKDKCNDNKLISLSKQIPGASSFPIKYNQYEFGDDYSISSEEIINELEILDNRSLTLKANELKKFGFNSVKEIEALGEGVSKNILCAIRLFQLINPIKEKFGDIIDYSWVGILFCKAIEIRMNDCFIEALQKHFPDYVIGEGKDGSHDSHKAKLLQNANKSDFTLGWYPAFFKKKKSELGSIMSQLNQSFYNEKWWDDFKSKIFVCKEERNACCHTASFKFENLEILIKSIFETSQTKNDISMRGILFESEVGLILKNDKSSLK